MTKLIRKERNIVYEYYEVEITDEQLELYKNDREKFMDELIYTDEIMFGEPKTNQYVNTTDTEYYLDGEDEPKFNY